MHQQPIRESNPRTTSPTTTYPYDEDLPFKGQVYNPETEPDSSPHSNWDSGKDRELLQPSEQFLKHIEAITAAKSRRQRISNHI